MSNKRFGAVIGALVAAAAAFEKDVNAVSEAVSKRSSENASREAIMAHRNLAIESATNDEEHDAAMSIKVPGQSRVKIPEHPEFKAVATRPGIHGSGIVLHRDRNDEPAIFIIDSMGCLEPFDLKVKDVLASDWTIF